MGVGSFSRRVAATGFVIRWSVLALFVISTSAAPAKADEWLLVDSPNFTVISNARTRVAAEVAEHLEQLRILLSAVEEDEAQRRAAPTLVFAFRDNPSLAEHLRPASKGGKRLAGFFLRAPERNLIALDASAGESTYGVVFHELVHDFTDRNFPNVPLWYKEGLAEYYSTFRLEKGQALVGMQQRNHRRYLIEHKLTPTHQMLAVTYTSPEYNEQSKAGAFYAQAWATVHYLLSSPELAARIGIFLDLCSADRPDAIQAAFGVSQDDFEQGLWKHVSSSRIPFFRVPVSSVAASIEVAELDQGEADERLQELSDALAVAQRGP
jgi:hypothetical protein